MSHGPSPRPDRSAPSDSDASAMMDRLIAILTPPGRVRRGAPRYGGRTCTADSILGLIQEIEHEPNPIVCLEGGSVGESDLELAASLPHLPNRPIVVSLGSAENMVEAITTARRLGLNHVLSAECLEHPRDLKQLVDWIDRGGPGLGLSPHLEPGSEIVRYRVRTKSDKPGIIEKALKFIRPYQVDPSFHFDARLILEELINNAIYHAFHDESGGEKYEISNFVRLAEDEEILVSVGADSSTIGLSVSDNQGSLSRDTVLSRLERHLSVRGLLDESGRGLYLTYSLAHRMLVNLEAGRRTELVALFTRREGGWPDRAPTRPVLVFERP